MGFRLDVKCQNCAYRKEFMLGVGFHQPSLENIIDTMKGKRKREMNEILQNHEVVNTNSFRTLFQCINCDSLSDKLFIKIIYDGNKEYETVHKCSRCKDEMRMLGADVDITTLPCPECKKKGLNKEITLWWD